MTHTLSLIGLVIVCLTGVVLATVQLPGTWLIVAGAAGYAWYDPGRRLGWTTVGVVLALAVGGEALEFFSSLWTARRAGGSRRASWYGLIGGMVGMLVFSIPVPVIGTILGGALGCAIGAVIGELSERDDLQHGLRVGLASSLGHALGAISKLFVAIIMAAITLAFAIW